MGVGEGWGGLCRSRQDGVCRDTIRITASGAPAAGQDPGKAYLPHRLRRRQRRNTGFLSDPRQRVVDSGMLVCSPFSSRWFKLLGPLFGF